MKAADLIGRGRTADVYDWEKNKVIKLFHKKMSKTYIQYEYEISKYLQEKLSFVPKVFELIEHQERLGIVYEKIEAITLLKYLTKNPLKVFREMRHFADLHIAIHEINYSSGTSLKNTLEEDINRAKDLDSATKKKINEILESLPVATNLCHRDFHPDNVFYTQQGLRVIDWMTATQGAPASDVARSYYILKNAATLEGTPFLDRVKIKMFQNIASKAYLRNYLKKSTITLRDVKKWEIVTIAARLAEGINEEKPYIMKRLKKLLRKYS